MAIRKYLSEGFLNMFCGFPVFVQRQKLDDPKLLELAIENPFHVYMVCRRNRITFDPTSVSFNGTMLSGQFIVHSREGKILVPFTSDVYREADDCLVQCDYPHSEVRFVDKKGDLIVGFHAGHMMSKVASYLQDYQQMEHLDFEVLYVGQAYGNDGERTAPDRLKSHETLLQIYADLAANAPEDEIWLCLLSFEPPITIMSFDGREKQLGTSNEEDLAHLERMLDDPVEERQRISFAEAALIRYFQPKYNDKFKYHFPNPSHSSYSQCYDADFNAIGVEVQFGELRFRVYSEAVPRGYNHLIQFALHNREERKSMFEYFV